MGEKENYSTATAINLKLISVRALRELIQITKELKGIL